jgi:hypothetical protein
MKRFISRYKKPLIEIEPDVAVQSRLKKKAIGAEKGRGLEARNSHSGIGSQGPIGPSVMSAANHPPEGMYPWSSVSGV